MTQFIMIPGSNNGVIINVDAIEQIAEIDKLPRLLRDDLPTSAQGWVVLCMIGSKLHAYVVTVEDANGLLAILGSNNLLLV